MNDMTNADNAMAEELAALKAFLEERRRAAPDDARSKSVEEIQSWITEPEPSPDDHEAGDAHDLAFDVIADALIHGSRNIDPGFGKVGASIQAEQFTDGDESSAKRNAAFVFAVLAFAGIHARLNNDDDGETATSIDAAGARLGIFPSLSIAKTPAVRHAMLRISEKVSRIVHTLVYATTEHGGNLPIQLSAMNYTLMLEGEHVAIKESRIDQVKLLTQMAYAAMMFRRSGREPIVPINLFEDCVSEAELGTTLADVIRRGIVVSNDEKMDARNLVYKLVTEFADEDGIDYKTDEMLENLLKAFFERISGSTPAPKGGANRRRKTR